MTFDTGDIWTLPAHLIVFFHTNKKPIMLTLHDTFLNLEMPVIDEATDGRLNIAFALPDIGIWIRREIISYDNKTIISTSSLLFILSVTRFRR